LRGRLAVAAAGSGGGGDGGDDGSALSADARRPLSNGLVCLSGGHLAWVTPLLNVGSMWCPASLLVRAVDPWRVRTLSTPAGAPRQPTLRKKKCAETKQDRQK